MIRRLEIRLGAADGEAHAERDVAVLLALLGGGAEADFYVVRGEAVGDDGAVFGDVDAVGVGGTAGAGGGEGDELGGFGEGSLAGDEGRGVGQGEKEEGGERLHFVGFGLMCGASEMR